MIYRHRAGTYTVSYLTSSNTCAVTGTFDVTITTDEDGTFSYAGSSGTLQTIYSEDFTGQNGKDWIIIQVILQVLIGPWM